MAEVNIPTGFGIPLVNLVTDRLPEPSMRAIQFAAETTLVYDGENVTSVTEDGVTTTYTYNADGTVDTDTRDGITREYTYDANGNVTGISVI